MYFPQLVPIGTTIFEGIRAVDIDAGVNGLSEYFIIPGDNKTLEEANAVDGYSYFSIPLPHQGVVTVNRTLDYERTKLYLVTIVASVSYFSTFVIKLQVPFKILDNNPKELRIKVI